MTKVVTSDYLDSMQVVNIKELKARLSAYLREVGRGETFLVTDRSRVVARLGPAEGTPSATGAEPEQVTRLVALGARPPLRQPRPTDYRRAGRMPPMSEQHVDALMNWLRSEDAT